MGFVDKYNLEAQMKMHEAEPSSVSRGAHGPRVLKPDLPINLQRIGRSFHFGFSRLDIYQFLDEVFKSCQASLMMRKGVDTSVIGALYLSRDGLFFTFQISESLITFPILHFPSSTNSGMRSIHAQSFSF